MSPNDSYAQHVVTAVIVGHDGAAWLAHGVDALLGQTRPVQRVVAVDTGSRDRSGAVLAAKLGQAAVFGMDRATGYAAAVQRALQHKAASVPVPAGQAGLSQAGPGRGQADQVEWIWLLHDDCEPAPDALEQLLRGAAETPAAAVLGPKLMDWTDRDVILEAGLSLDGVGRRITGVEPREVDQGQHDGDHDVLAVSSAGMLIRRDVWDQVGGFDPSMTLFGEDIDLCWRVHGVGLRVRVITDAVVFHAMAATRGRRAISVGRRARLLDRRHGLQTLLANLPTGPMLVSLLGNLTISLLRTVFYTVAKRGTAALDEAAAVADVVGHPVRFGRARARRARGRRAAYSRVRADLPPGRSIRRAAEFLALVLSRSAGRHEPAAGHSATDDPTDDDSLLIDSGFVQRFVTRPGVLLIFGLIVIAAVAQRSLVGGGPLGGGALAPAWEGASQLWGEVLQAFHPSGIGSASAAPPYAGFVALLATVLLGKVWLAVDVLLLGSVPLAGLTALLAVRRVTRSPWVRVWAAASYALLPVAFGAVAAGRLGSAVAFALIPLIGLCAGRMFSEPPRLARRAAWATGLAVTVGTAFVPVLWPMAVVAAVIAAVTLRRSRPMLINLGIVALSAPVLLLPWMSQLLAHPSWLLLEAGVQQQGLATAVLPARSLLLLSPGGPGLPPYWVSAALVLTALAALLAARRRALIVAGWSVALLGFATAAEASRVVVTPPGGQQVTPWPGPALAVAAAGLILAAAAGAEGLGRTLAARGRKAAARAVSPRGLGVALLSLAAVSAPLLAAGYWLVNGVTGPITQASGQVVPALVTPAGDAGRQLRTLVLTSVHGHVFYLLLRGDSPEVTDSGLVPVAAAQTALSNAVGALVAPGGDQAASQSELLAHFDIGFVLMRPPLSPGLVSVLDEVAGLSQVSMTPNFDLWKLATLPSRVSVVEPSGAVVQVTSGAVGVPSAAAPAAGGTLELAEPAGGWQATLNGHALTTIPSPAGSWAQAFKLPPGGGTLAIGRNGLTHDLVITLELLAFVLVAALALPGVRTAAELEATAAASAPEDAQAPADQELEPAAAVAGSGEEAGLQAPGGRGRAAVTGHRTAAQGAAGRARRAVRGRAAAGRGRVGGRRGKGPLPDGSEAAPPAERLGTRRGTGRPLRPGVSGAAAAAAAGTGATPADEPTSRFMSSAPGSHRSDSGDRAARTPERTESRDDRSLDPAALRPGRGDSRPRPGPSPSGTRYDDVDGGPAQPRRAYPPRPAEARSPSGSPYLDEPATPAPGRSQRGYEPAAGWRDRDPRDTPSAGQDRLEALPPRGRGHRRSRDSDAPRPAAPSRPGADQAQSWQPDERVSSWPEPSRQRGWPQERPPDYQHGYSPEPAPQPQPAWHVPDQGGWPEQGEALEALPPIGEVHHDWPERDSRQHRGWLAPEDETDGETW